VSRSSFVSKLFCRHGGQRGPRRWNRVSGKKHQRQLWMPLLLIAVAYPAFSQKVAVGYDKTIDFSRYKTYVIPKPSMQPTRPVLYSTVMGAIYNELKAKHFEASDTSGDLILICTGGMELGTNIAAGVPILPTYSGPPPSVNATMWTGAAGPDNLRSAPYVPEGNLMLTFVDPNLHKIVWSGTVTQKLDIEQKNDSLKRVEKAISKLLQKFPPNNK
jgi:hypothetical protein